MKPKKQNKQKIKTRRLAAKMLLEARRLAERGWIKEGRRSTACMLMDCLEEAFVRMGGRRDLFGYISLTPPDLGLAMGYMCRCTYRRNDPGANRARFKQLFGQDGSEYMVCRGGVFETFRQARNLALDEIKELSEGEK